VSKCVSESVSKCVSESVSKCVSQRAKVNFTFLFCKISIQAFLL